MKAHQNQHRSQKSSRPQDNLRKTLAPFKQSALPSKLRGKNADSEAFPSRTTATVEISLKAISLNFEILRSFNPSLKLLPMVKANAYGHGAKEVSSYLAKTYERQDTLYGFGVATLEEGIQVRKSLGSVHSRLSVIVFSGSTPWRPEAYELCKKYHLTPTLTSLPDLEIFFKLKHQRDLPYEIKFNTGMNRLGIPAEEALSVRRLLKTHASVPTGIFSHLALGEDARHSLSQKQRQSFTEIRRAFSFLEKKTTFHLGNSGAICNPKQWKLSEFSECARPGLSLYGISPQPKKSFDFIPAMRVFSPIIARHVLKAGDRIGYGGTPLNKARSTHHVAVIRTGYADGLHRCLSRKGQVGLFDGTTLYPRLYEVLGTISMDLCSISCHESTKPGDWAQILGAPIDLWTQARLAGTIPYELLTSISQRVKRVYAK